MHQNMPIRRIIFRLFFAALVAAVFVHGCTADAPRDNPLDPINGLTVAGRVERLYTNMPINGALLTLEPNGLIDRADSEGRFQFGMLRPGQYQLICEASGFVTDTVTLDVQQTVNHTFKLNGLPRFNRFSLTTTRISRFFPPDDKIEFDFEVAASDPDDPTDVESMIFQIEDIIDTVIVDQISSTANERIFARRNISQLDLGGIEMMNEVIGKEIRFFVKDRPGITVVSQPQFLSRIIDQTPIGLFPRDEDPVSVPFTMTWEDMDLPFTHTYSLGVAVAFGEEIEQIDNIAASQTSFVYTRPLSAGSYVWFLYIVDEFGNRSRSRLNPFVIQ